MASLPTSDKNDKNKKNDSENRKPTSMWRDDVDTPQTSMGGGFRGVPMGLSSQVHSMGFQEPSFDSGYVWGPKPGGSKTSAVISPGIDGKKGKENANQSSKLKKAEDENVVTTKQEESKMTSKSNEKVSGGGYKNPIDEFKNNSDVEPSGFNKDFCVLDCPRSILDADSLKKAVVLSLTKLVAEGYVDWDYENKYTFQGRIYKSNEDAGYRITIYLLTEKDEEEDEENKCVLEVRRNGGDSFLFHEFKSKFLNLMSDDKAIKYEKGGKFTMERGFLSLFDDDDVTSDSEDLLTPLSSSMASDAKADDDDNSKKKDNFDANVCVEEAIDTKRYGVLRYRACVAFLRNSSDNEARLKKITQVDKVIDKLLKPINGDDQIYDTLVIKSLLEVIDRIVCADSSLASGDNVKAIKNINQQWSEKVDHPYSESIGKFIASQQIQWVSSKCLEHVQSGNGDKDKK